MNEKQLDIYVRLASTTKATGADRYTKPLYGGVWGNAEYMLGAILSLENNFPSITYLVFHRASFIAVGLGATKEGALEQARAAVRDRGADIKALAPAVIQHFQQEEERRLEAIRAHYRSERQEKPIPKRRQQIFDKSEGKCHYCGTSLTLDGRWHIEHKMPRALMGGNEPSNLVASCVPCNHKKRDKTDQEFIAQQANA